MHSKSELSILPPSSLYNSFLCISLSQTFSSLHMPCMFRTSPYVLHVPVHPSLYNFFKTIKRKYRLWSPCLCNLSVSFLLHIFQFELSYLGFLPQASLFCLQGRIFLVVQQMPPPATAVTACFLNISQRKTEIKCSCLPDILYLLRVVVDLCWSIVCIEECVQETSTYE